MLKRKNFKLKARKSYLFTWLIVSCVLLIPAIAVELFTLPHITSPWRSLIPFGIADLICLAAICIIIVKKTVKAINTENVPTPSSVRNFFAALFEAVGLFAIYKPVSVLIITWIMDLF